MELTGKVILDEDTMDMLKEEVREEVIEDIKNNGNYSSEIETYLNDCNIVRYQKILEDTIDNVISNDTCRNSNCATMKTYNKLLAIQAILNI